MTVSWGDRATEPPVARREPRARVIHGETLVDPYDWLRERGSPEVQAYLEGENAFTDASMRSTEELQETLYRELVGRIQETDSSVPVPIDDYFYYRRTVEGLQYPIHCRRRGSLEAPEEVIFDLNVLGADRSFLALGALSVSPDHRWLAYSLNEDGSESFTLRVLDLERSNLLEETIEKTSPSVVWANDSRTLFYVVRDAARRPYQVYRHVLGAAPEADELLYHETDERFFVSVFKTRSRRYLGIFSGSAITSEIHVLDADRPAEGFDLLIERRHGVELDLDHHGDGFYVLTNQAAINFKLARLEIARPEPEHWVEVLPHSEEIQLESIDCFRDHLVVHLRRDGLRRLLVIDLATDERHEIELDEPAYTVAALDNRTFDTHRLRFAYSSLVTPRSIIDYDVKTRTRELKKQTEVLGGYDRRRYRCERIEARAADGVAVPISLVYSKELTLDGSHPALLGGYGAYGTSVEPRFAAFRLSLLERGFVVALAHVRGGGELGRRWYEDGKLLHKKNTFGDFIAAAEHLVARGYTSPRRLVIRGGSAGGLLIGAVINQRPDLFHAAIADVPFVDALNTMLDPTVPLTVTELEEWGDPSDPDVFHYIREYSPYDNVVAARYPHLLVTAGLNDPRVQYWEPAKWVAKLRALSRGHRRLLLRMFMDSGHGGASGRYDALRQEAFRLAFLLSSLESP